MEIGHGMELIVIVSGRWLPVVLRLIWVLFRPLVASNPQQQVQTLTKRYIIWG